MYCSTSGGHDPPASMVSLFCTPYLLAEPARCTCTLYPHVPKRRQIAEYTESTAESMEEYLPKWETVAGRSPAFKFVLPLVEALAKSARPLLPASDAGLLRKPLHATGMRCGLPSCGKTEKVATGLSMQPRVLS